MPEEEARIAEADAAAAEVLSLRRRQARLARVEEQLALRVGLVDVRPDFLLELAAELEHVLVAHVGQRSRPPSACRCSTCSRCRVPSRLLKPPATLLPRPVITGKPGRRRRAADESQLARRVVVEHVVRRAVRIVEAQIARRRRAAAASASSVLSRLTRIGVAVDLLIAPRRDRHRATRPAP